MIAKVRTNRIPEARRFGNHRIEKLRARLDLPSTGRAASICGHRRNADHDIAPLTS